MFTLMVDARACKDVNSEVSLLFSFFVGNPARTRKRAVVVWRKKDLLQHRFIVYRFSLTCKEVRLFDLLLVGKNGASRALFHPEIALIKIKIDLSLTWCYSDSHMDSSPRRS